MIEVRGLKKTYGGFAAVADSTFSVAEGEVFGIVGPNGAGKTTTLKMLAGLIEPTNGEARVAGFDSTDPEMRQQLGFLPEESPLYEEMTPRSYLRFFADLYAVPRDVATERVETTLDRLSLDHRERRLGDMSKGMKRKVAIARSLVNDPDVVIYDEPASGLDPVTTNTVLEFTRELRAEGKTVVFSAHNLHQVESVCDRVIIMNEGRIVARGSVEEIRDRHGETTYHVYTDVSVTVPTDGTEWDPNEGITEGTPNEDVAGADGRRAPLRSEPVGDRYRVAVPSMATVEDVREAADAVGGEVVDIRSREPSLEDIFLDVVGRTPDRPRTVDDDFVRGDGQDASAEPQRGATAEEERR
ncbi:ABC transporter ATP-binding protein [Halorubrum vacuolatum]|uniref:ABC-2 type transport system ATP-binding protein n=1 Tax=Halorubrum vacuolatum TaxID=63740 RepID=A0A238VE75_HALVU|nr:ABC transporter ATP-binding protein [Halorubrum vacuolatum]SNR31993.1 ABC-2 type transport system ATP-binding protein [Halorubrum vacuolatum]